jgi:hypothetical protein
MKVQMSFSQTFSFLVFFFFIIKKTSKIWNQRKVDQLDLNTWIERKPSWLDIDNYIVDGVQLACSKSWRVQAKYLVFICYFIFYL